MTEILREKEKTKSPEKTVTKAIDLAVEEVTKKIKTTATTKAAGLPIPIIGRVTLPISLDLATKKPDPKQAAIQNYFDRGDLDAAKKKGKIVVLSQPDLNLVKPSLETSIVYHRDDVQKVINWSKLKGTSDSKMKLLNSRHFLNLSKSRNEFIKH